MYQGMIPHTDPRGVNKSGTSISGQTLIAESTQQELGDIAVTRSVVESCQGRNVVRKERNVGRISG